MHAGCLGEDSGSIAGMEGQEPYKKCVSTLFAALLAVLSLQLPGRAQGSAKTPIVVTGSVIDEAGKPIVGAAVTAVMGQEIVDTSALLKKPPHVSKQDGSFAVPLDTEGLRWGRVIVAAKGRQSLAMQITQEHVKHGGDFGQILLPVGGQLIGRVRDEQGAAMAGVTIDVASAIKDQIGYRAVIKAGGVSNQKGIFSVPCVPRTGLELTASSLGYGTIRKIVAQGSPINLTMQRTGLVHGKVVDGEGKPIVGATVSVMCPANLVGPPRSIYSASDGTFAVAAPPQGLRYRIAAYEQGVPYRQFSSGLLRGPQENVVVTSWTADGQKERQLIVEVRDAKTKQPVEKFTLQQVTSDASNLQIVMFHAREGEQHENGRGTLNLRGANTKGILVRAPGFAFEIVPLLDESDETLVVELGPEAVLTGVVTDADTGKPMPGVHVRALPKGRSSGSGGTLDGIWPVSDAQGRYRMGGLRPGEYGVQAHAADRVASRPDIVTVAVEAVAEHDLQVPPLKQARLKILGDLPDGPARLLFPGMQVNSSSLGGGFQHHMQGPRPVALVESSTIEFGPLATDELNLTVYVPSRTRAGTGTHVPLGPMRLKKGEMELLLPDLRSTLVRGRIEVGETVPFERLGVLATPLEEGRRPRFRFANGSMPCLAGVGSDGAFAIDLPPGKYCLQLADAMTGIVFHTEAEDYIPSDKPLVLKPTVHWLHVVCRPKRKGDPCNPQAISIELVQPRDGKGKAFINSGSRHNNVASSSTSMPMGTLRQRWLVPAGEIRLALQHSFHSLQPWQRGWTMEKVSEVSVQIEKAHHELVLTVPTPPTDEEILKR